MSAKRKVVSTVVASPSGATPTPPAIAHLQKPALAALRSSLTTGSFIDCQFYLYSHRDVDGTVDTPRAIYASSEVLIQTADHFRSLVSGGFSESYEGPGGGTQGRLRSRIPADEYEYESDSDLDDDEPLDHGHVPPTPPEAPSPGNGTRKDVSVATEPPVALVDGALPPVALEGELVNGDKLQLDETNADTPGVENEFHLMSSNVPVRHVVVIPDVAFRTFEALVYYIYTGEVSFTTLKSRMTPGENKPQPNPGDVVACSPKSMYRLADKYGLTVLRDLAVKNLRTQLSSKNAMHELLSRFTARYPEVITIETEFICGPNRRLDSFSDVQEWTQRLVSGDIPHAGEALARLIRRLASTP